MSQTVTFSARVFSAGRHSKDVIAVTICRQRRGAKRDPPVIAGCDLRQWRDEKDDDEISSGDAISSRPVVAHGGMELRRRKRIARKLFSLNAIKKRWPRAQVWHAVCLMDGRGERRLLRISIENTADETTLKVEGKLMGPWIGELAREWKSLLPFPEGRKLFLDLRAMTFVDRAGVETLHGIWRVTGAEILADTPLTRDFVRKIRGATLSGKRD